MRSSEDQSDQDTDNEECGTEDDLESETDSEPDNATAEFLLASLFVLIVLFVVQGICNDLFGRYDSAI